MKKPENAKKSVNLLVFLKFNKKFMVINPHFVYDKNMEWGFAYAFNIFRRST